MLAFACLLICLHIRYVWRFLLLCFGQLLLLLRGEGTKKKENRTENVKCKNVHDLASSGAITTNEGSVGSALILRQQFHSEKIKEGSDSDEDKISPVQERPTAGKKEEEESTNRQLRLARIATTESNTDNGEGCHANGCSNNHEDETSGGQQQGGRAPQQLAQWGERIFSPYQYYLAAAVQSCLEDRGSKDSRITSSSDRISVQRPAGELQRIISLRRTTDGHSHA